MPCEFIEQTEKAREKQRRLALREEKMEKQRIEQEKRAERSLERAHVSKLMSRMSHLIISHRQSIFSMG